MARGGRGLAPVPRGADMVFAFRGEGAGGVTLRLRCPSRVSVTWTWCFPELSWAGCAVIWAGSLLDRWAWGALLGWTVMVGNKVYFTFIRPHAPCYRP